MYDFVNTTDNTNNERLPAEALRLNGAWLEHIVPGYRTLYTRGRESLSADVTTQEYTARAGSLYRGRRYPERTITVGFQMLAPDPAEFHRRWNILAGILNCEEAELVFADESDKYFIGTPSEIEEPEPGRLNVTCEMSFLCTDPFKYSLEEYEIEPSLDDGVTFEIDYQGTVPAYPVLEASFYKENDNTGPLTGNGDCGYVAFIDSDEHIIQLGDPEEVDGEGGDKSQTLINSNFQYAANWGATAQAIWAVNRGVVSSSYFAQTGTVALQHGYNTTADGTYYMTASGYGSGVQGHGPTISASIPADALGIVGAEDWVFSYCQKISIASSGGTNQYGCFQAIVSDANGDILVGVAVYKNVSGSKGSIRFYKYGGAIAKTVGIDLSYSNKYFGNNSGTITTVKTSTITKEGTTVRFNCGGYQYEYTDPNLAGKAATKITFLFANYSGRPALPFNGLYWAKFIKTNCDTYKDVPNKFSTNDVVTADCSDGSVALNGAPAPELGALGNDWEKFRLNPGSNYITTAYSDWVDPQYKPAFKIKYREVFL